MNRNAAKFQILLATFSKNRSLKIFPFFMNMALKASSINWCLLKKKSSWESYLIFIRVDNPVPIWQKHCSLSNKTIRKGLERKMSRVDPLITQVSLCYHFTYFCALTIWSIFILEKHNFIYLYKFHFHLRLSAPFCYAACLHKGTHQIKIFIVLAFYLC